MTYTCPCCGYKTFTRKPGSYDICEVCNWEDDLSQLYFPRELGANKLSLIEAQQVFEEFSKSNIDLNAKKLKYAKDLKWRMIDITTDQINIYVPDVNFDYPINPEDLYYWNNNIK